MSGDRTGHIVADAHSASDTSDPQQDAEFWFEDGSIVLIAQDIAFRVHRGVLSRHSEVFRDLLKVPGKQEEKFGCPFVHLSDSPADLRSLLRVLYDGAVSHLDLETPLEFAEVATLVRLSHKYGIKSLLEKGLARLKTVFTKGFSTWESLHCTGSFIEISVMSPFLKAQPEDAIAVVRLARLTGALTMLPTALFVCCSLEPTVLTRAYTLSDGSNNQLSLQDLERCMRAAPILSSSFQTRHTLLHLETSPQCENHRYTPCSSRLARQLKIYFESNTVTCLNVLHGRQSSIRDSGVCGACQTFIQKKDRERGQKYWADLPSYFGLGTWGGLSDFPIEH
ncbi:hypothetical protein SCP_1503320 [Sparassis crispa]|uniref:BTB domain-containing protein n=1 Tax=Sparassis crispa TaxID=139825 RepID=A0A401H4I0_9APHY|nr:hypothetical protein SCP_1503320 [Sparassis crispa]GBE89324.1 hypothetical protein SCP_1503320 [Sparassis crispa]